MFLNIFEKVIQMHGLQIGNVSIPPYELLKLKLSQKKRII